MSNSFPPFFVLRHGQTQWNVERRLQGHKDSPLTDLGRAQAAVQGRLLAGILDHEPIEHLYCSPLGRARHTAQIAARNLSLQYIEDARLQEVSAGEWEGLTRPDIFAQLGWKDEEDAEFELFLNAPGGERYKDVQARCLSFLQDLSAPAVIVTHGVTSTILRGLALDLPEKSIANLPRGQGCIYVVRDGQETCLQEDQTTA